MVSNRDGEQPEYPTVTTQCYCGLRFDCEDIFVGHEVNCPRCGDKLIVGGPSAQEQKQSAIDRGKLLGRTVLCCGFLVVCLGIGDCLLAKTLGRRAAQAAIPRTDGMIVVDDQTAKWFFDAALDTERSKYETIGVVVTGFGAILGLYGFVLYRWGILQEMRFRLDAQPNRGRTDSKNQ